MLHGYSIDEELTIEQLSDDQVRAICTHQLAGAQQVELTTLLGQQREGELSAIGRARLGVLLNLYQQGLVQRAQALAVAVGRGLLPPLD